MAGETAKLIGYLISPFMMRPRIAFNLSGAEYEVSEETIGSKSELLLKSNPVYKKIPVLLHGDRAICESMIIVEYIQDTWGSASSRILPNNPYDRAIARFWAFYVDDKWSPRLLALLRAKTAEERAACREQLLEATQLLEGAFQKCSRGKGFFGGDRIGYVDIALGCYLGWVKALEERTGIKILGEGDTPSLLGWAERFCAQEPVKGVMPATDKLLDFWKECEAGAKTATAAN